MQDINLFAELGMAAPNVPPQIVDGGKVLSALFATVAPMSRGCDHCQGLVRTDNCEVKVKFILRKLIPATFTFEDNPRLYCHWAQRLAFAFVEPSFPIAL